ncbi:MAG TPA: hypothetical protein VMU02_07405 [bacterium]|nr:hypothetical protein [bacterium]
MKSQPKKLLAWVAIALVVNLTACELAAAADATGVPPDSLGARPGKVEAPAPSARATNTRIIMSEDGLDGLSSTPPEQAPTPAPSENARGGTPFYKNKWVWIIGTSVLAGTATAILIGRGEKAREDLPGFPEPPTQ